MCNPDYGYGIDVAEPLGWPMSVPARMYIVAAIGTFLALWSITDSA